MTSFVFQCTSGWGNGIDLDFLSDHDLLCVKAGDSFEVLEESLSAPKVLIDDFGGALQVFEKGYVDLLH